MAHVIPVAAAGAHSIIARAETGFERAWRMHCCAALESSGASLLGGMLGDMACCCWYAC